MGILDHLRAKLLANKGQSTSAFGRGDDYLVNASQNFADPTNKMSFGKRVLGAFMSAAEQNTIGRMGVVGRIIQNQRQGLTFRNALTHNLSDIAFGAFSSHLGQMGTLGLAVQAAILKVPQVNDRKLPTTQINPDNLAASMQEMDLKLVSNVNALRNEINTGLRTVGQKVNDNFEKLQKYNRDLSAMDLRQRRLEEALKKDKFIGMQFKNANDDYISTPPSGNDNTGLAYQPNREYLELTRKYGPAMVSRVAAKGMVKGLGMARSGIGGLGRLAAAHPAAKVAAGVGLGAAALGGLGWLAYRMLFSSAKADELPKNPIKNEGKGDVSEINVVDYKVYASHNMSFEAKNDLILKGARIVLDANLIQIKGTIDGEAANKLYNPQNKTQKARDANRQGNISSGNDTGTLDQPWYSSTWNKLWGNSGYAGRSGGGRRVADESRRELENTLSLDKAIPSIGMASGTNVPLNIPDAVRTGNSLDRSGIFPGTSRNEIKGSENGHPVLTEARAKAFAEMDADPALKQKVLELTTHELGHHPAGPLESLVNRAAYTGHSIRDLVFNQGFYGPINRGTVGALSPEKRKAAEEAYESVRRGSNSIRLRTDQGMINEHKWADAENRAGRDGGKIEHLGEWYSHKDAKGRQWAYDTEAKMRKYDEEHKNVSNNVGPLINLERVPTKQEIDDSIAKGNKTFHFDPSQSGSKEALDYIKSKGGNATGYWVGGGSKEFGEKELDLTSKNGIEAIKAKAAEMASQGYSAMQVDNLHKLTSPEQMKAVFDAVHEGSGGKLKIVPNGNHRLVADLIKKDSSYKDKMAYGLGENLAKGTQTDLDNANSIAKSGIPFYDIEFGKGKNAVELDKAKQFAQSSGISGVYWYNHGEGENGKSGGITGNDNMIYSTNNTMASGPSAKMLRGKAEPSGVSGSYITPNSLNSISATKLPGNVIYPVTGDIGGARTSQFGMERGRLHAGVDIYARNNENKLQVGDNAPVHATVDGKIIASRPSQGYGYITDIRGEDGIIYRYAHIAPVVGENGKPLPIGSTVKQGQVLGHVTGAGTHFDSVVQSRFGGDAQKAVDYFDQNGWPEGMAKPHLHFETRTAPNSFGGQNVVDPQRIFGPAMGLTGKGDRMISGTVMTNRGAIIGQTNEDIMRNRYIEETGKRPILNTMTGKEVEHPDYKAWKQRQDSRPALMQSTVGIDYSKAYDAAIAAAQLQGKITMKPEEIIPKNDPGSTPSPSTEPTASKESAEPTSEVKSEPKETIESPTHDPESRKEGPSSDAKGKEDSGYYDSTGP